MEAKLIKEEGWYDLYRIDEDGKKVTFASTQDYKQKLSLKNCQAIERGFDLDELAKKFRDETIMNSSFISDETSFKEGAKAILEILGDKKFSEKDMENAIEMCIKLMNDKGSEFREHKQTVIQSLQQTEWDVEIVEEEVHQLKKRAGGIVNMGKPLLDADGNLILKRK